MSNANVRMIRVRYCLVTLLIVGAALICFGLFALPARPYFQLDALLTNAELNDDETRQATLSMLKQTNNSDAIFWSLAGMVVSTLSAYGLWNHRRIQDDSSDNPARWKYVIHIPFLNGTRVLRGADLIPTDDTAASDIDLGPACEVQFDDNASAGRDALAGRYRLANQTGWTVFQFSRSTCATPTFRLALPAAQGGSGSGRLTCRVPKDVELNQAYVLRVLGDVCGQTAWRAISRPVDR